MTGNKATNADWFEDRERVQKVVFKDKLYPDDVSLWFDQCTNLVEVEKPENLDLTRTERMMDLFYGCTKLKKLDVTSWDTSNVNNMHGLFSGCSSLTELDVSGWDTSNVTDLSSTFSGCSSLTTLDLSGWDTSGSIYFGGMFTGCTKLKTIYASDKFVTSGATTELQTTNVFTGCPALVGGNGTTYSAAHTDVTYTRIDTPKAPGYFTAKERKDNTIQCSESFTKTADAQKDQTFQLNASANGAPLSYKSDSKQVTVDEKGKVTINKGFVGKATITITAAETEQYKSAKLRVTVTVNPGRNTIKVQKSITKTVNTKKEQTFKLDASANGASLSYKSGNTSKVTVDKNGKVTIKKGFVGKVTITITSKATKLYLAAEKKITVAVIPSATNLSSVKGAGKKVTVKWKKNNTAKGYELQFSLKNNFRKIEKTVRVTIQHPLIACLRCAETGHF